MIEFHQLVIRSSDLKKEERRQTEEKMKCFALLCLLFLAWACLFVARADEETSAVVLASPKMEDQKEAAVLTAEDEEETTDVAEDDPEKRRLRCRQYRKGKLLCSECGCRPVLILKWCTRKVCRKVKCTINICRIEIKYKIVKYKYTLPYYPGYGPRWVWKTKKVPYKVRVCKIRITVCLKCTFIQRYICGRIVVRKCKYRKCSFY